MSDQHNHGSNRDHGTNGGFEREDLGPKTVYGFLAILAVIGVLVFFVVGGVYHALDGYYRTHQAAQSPLKQGVEGDSRDLHTSEVKKHLENTFPQPLLETDERNELNGFRMQEANQLSSYGWVDQKAGVLHIPIERAMQLIAERGLPVRPGEPGSVVPAKTAPVAKKASASSVAK